MELSRPQLNLDELRRLKWLLGGLLALVSLWTVFFLDVEALSLVALASGVVAATLVWPALPARVPPLAWRLAVPAIIALTVADWIFSREILPVLIRLGVMLVLYRGSGYRRKREDLQLIVLGLFLVVVAGVLTVSLGFAALLLLFTACALGFLFVITLIDMAENTAVALTYEEMSQCPEWARRDWRGFFRRWREVADWKLFGLTTVLFGGVVAMSAVLFLAIPRFEIASGFFLDKYITRKSRSGFTETVRFGDVTDLVRDNSVAMRVDLSEASALRETPYWRLIVLDEYGKEGFRMSVGLKNELLRSQRVLQSLRGRAPARAVGGTWTFYVEPGVSRFLPLPGAYGQLRLRDPAPVQVTTAQRLVALRTESLAMTAFQLEAVELGATVRDAGFSALLRGGGRAGRYDARLSLALPEGEANRATLRRVVAEIAGGGELTAEEFARRATSWLQARHAYALSAKIPRGEGDDIVKWLDSREVGFCEYFAASLAVLGRAAGFPTRVVAGFRGGTLNVFENYYMVRNSDAHAWVEIFDGKSAWLRADPTPGIGGATETLAAAASQVHDSSWSARLDSLRVIWYRRIVSFDARQQQRLVDEVKNFASDRSVALRGWLEKIVQRTKGLFSAPANSADGWRRWGVAGGMLAGGVLAIWAWVRVWRNLVRGAGKGMDPVRREAGRWLARLALANGETEVRADLLRLRFGAREGWPEPQVVFRRARALARRGARGRPIRP